MQAKAPTTFGQNSTAADKLPRLALFGLIIILIPGDFVVGSLALSPARVMFLILVPIFLIQFLRGAYGRINIVDILIFAHIFWIILSIARNNPELVVQFAGSNALAVLGGYMLARATIRTPGDFKALVRFTLMVALISVPFVIIESVLGRLLIQETLGRIPGFRTVLLATDEKRLGLFRAGFVFPNPIHYGLIMSLLFVQSLVGMERVWNAGKRTIGAVLSATCCFFSLSSGAVLAVVVQLFLISWHWLTRTLGAQRWVILLLFGIIFYIIAEIGSDRPALIAILSRASFVAGNVYIRQALFEYGMEQLPRTPVFGVGFNEWDFLPPWMPTTMDNFWLLQALVYGIPAFAFIFGAVICGIAAVSRRPFKGIELTSMRLGWCLAMTSMSLTMATVTVWAMTHSLVMFMIGAGVWMIGFTEQTRDESEEQEDAPDPQAIMYTRFLTKPVGHAREMRAGSSGSGHPRPGPVTPSQVSQRNARTRSPIPASPETKT